MSTDNDLTPNINKLELNDTLFTWFTATNKLIEYVNPLQVYDVFTGNGLTESRLNGEVTINLNVGKALKLFPDIGNGDLTLDIEGVYSSLATVRDTDYFIIERADTGNTNYLYSVHASDILPPTVNDDHDFLGEITVNDFNVNSSTITLGLGSSVQPTAGLIIYPSTVNEESFLYNSSLNSWVSSANFLLGKEYSFISNSNDKDAYFRFSTNSGQYDVVLELAMGFSSTTGDDHSWRIEGRNFLNSLDFVYNTSATTDVDHVIFSARIDNTSTAASTFVIYDKIEIGNVAGSTTNFSQVTDFTQYKIPISNADGVLDEKWVNRYVTSDYVGISVGDLVKIFDNTNSDTYITKCSLTTSSTEESDTYSIGIVERISGGKAYIALLGEFNLETTPSPALEPGLTYYLTSGTPNFTKIKPTSGIVKPVFVATGAGSGIIFPMASNALSFGTVAVSAAGGVETGYLVGSGNSVFSNASNGIINLVAGNGIALETDPTSREVIIRAITQGNEPGYSKVSGDSGSQLLAITPYDTLKITGGGGGINVVTDNNTDNDQVLLQGSYFRTVEFTGDDTNHDTGFLTASVDDTLTLYGGTGIRLSNPSGNMIRFEATGDFVSTIANNSLTLKQLQKQPKNSVLITGGSSTLMDVTTLQATVPSILLYTGLNTMTWATPATFFNFVSEGASLTGTIVPTSRRFLGISAHTPGSTTPIGGTNGTAAFFTDTTYKPNSINNVRMALIQGTGITLQVVNDATSGEFVGVPGIKISNSDSTSKFRNVVITNTNETISADVSGNLRLTSPSGSPISLDADSNSDTVFFNITNGTITNAHLAEMPDNTVKVGKGDTSNIATDLLIQENSVLGRLTGELVSLNSTNIKSILGLTSSNYFNTLTTDSGSVFASDTESIDIRGGSGISISVGTNNEIVVTNTIPGVGDGGISLIGSRSLPTFTAFGTTYTFEDGVSGINKLYYGIADLQYTFEKTSTTTGVITPRIAWSKLGQLLDGTDNDVVNGVGLMYAGIVAGESFTTKFAQIGNGVTGYHIPYFDPSTQTLAYVSKNNITRDSDHRGASLATGRLLAFDNNGLLTETSRYLQNIESGIIGLQVETKATIVDVTFTDTKDKYIYEDKSVPLSFNNFKAVLGTYWAPASALHQDTTEGRNFTFATTQATANFTDTVRIKFAQSLFLDTGLDEPAASYSTISGTDIIVRNFSSSWYNLSSSKLCLPTIMIGTGPTNSSSAASNGYTIRNDSSNGSLVFTNYNLNAYGSRTTAKDRSARLSLEVINVDPASSATAYSALKTTGSISHTYVDVSTVPGQIDQFTMSGRKSVKYLIQAVNNADKAFTTEFIVQVNTSTNYCNYIQYASVAEPAGFSLDITASLASGTVTVSNNSVALGITLTSVKVMKLEI